MNFALARSKIKTPLNPIAYIGMLGDVAALGLIYGIYYFRKENKKRVTAANAENERLTQL